MFYPGKDGALRAGVIDDNQWDNALVGSNSVAFNYNTIAYGGGSFATGCETQARGTLSSVFGRNTI